MRDGRVRPVGRRLPLDRLPTPPAVRDALRRLLDEAEAAAPGRLMGLVLFGSHARGDARPDSDVDVLIEWAGDHSGALDVLIRITTDILIDTGVDISVHPRSPDELAELRRMPTGFYEAVEEDGVLVEG